MARMELLVAVVVLLVLGAVLIGGLGFLGAIGLLGREEKAQKRAEENAPVLLDEAFDGRDDVVYKAGPGTLKVETVVLGAKARGYRLLNQSDEPGNRKTLVFTRA